jgi:hypothetical protein
MLLFRSEQHIDRWCRQWNRTRGGVLTLTQVWGLATEWYGNRLSPQWRPKTTAEGRATFATLGLVSDFWKLPD